jgi:glycosyltransferase involved in cell wall biosynthesis
MRIALVTQHYPPHFEGGTEAVVRSQARELAELGHDVRVVSGTDRAHSGQDVLRAEVDGLRVAFLPRRADEPYDLELARPRLAPLLLQETAGADVVHVHHWSTLCASLARLLAPRARVVLTLHDLFVTCPRFFRVPAGEVECGPRGVFEPCGPCLVPDAPGSAAADLARGAARRAAELQRELDAARVVLVPSQAHRERLGELVRFDDAHVFVVPHGLVRPLRRARAPAAWDGRSRLRLLFLGHRSALKGVLDLAHAIGGLPEVERARVDLLLLGSAVERGIDERLRQAARGATLEFLGDYDHAHLAERLSAAGGAHLAALPSRAWESYALVVDEALALGLPVWVGDRGAPRERVGGAGRVLSAARPEAWTGALSALFGDPEPLARETAAVPFVLRTAADAARELDALYKKLLVSAA